MSQYNSKVQNQFLSNARKRHLRVEVILETGTVLRGKVKGYDQFSISLTFKDKVEIIYKSSVIYIAVMPPRRPPPRSFDRAPRRYEPQDKSKQRYPDFFEDDFADDPPPPKKPLKI